MKENTELSIESLIDIFSKLEKPNPKRYFLVTGRQGAEEFDFQLKKKCVIDSLEYNKRQFTGEEYKSLMEMIESSDRGNFHLAATIIEARTQTHGSTFQSKGSRV